MQKEIFPYLPLSDYKQILLKNDTAQNPLTQESFLAKMDLYKPYYVRAPHIFTFLQSATPESLKPFSSSYHFSIKLLFFH